MAIKTTAKKKTTHEPNPGKRSTRETGVSEDQIRVRAYEIHLARGDGPGDATSDWLQAERELLGSEPAK